MRNDLNMIELPARRSERLSTAFITAPKALATVLTCLIALIGAAEATDAPSKPLNVVATIKPVHSLVASVMQGAGEPKLLIDGAHSPHHYALKPSDAEAVHGADVLVRISPDVETFTRKLIAALPDSVTVLTLDTVDGLTHLPARDTHSHSNDAPKSQHTKSDGTTKGAHQIDPHVWLDPQNGKRILEAIATELSALAPQHADRFNKNAEAAAKRLDDLEYQLRQTLEGVKNKPFVVFHDAFQYFEHRFSLNDLGAVSLHPEVPPSAKQISHMRDVITSNSIKCVFSDPQFDTRRLANVIEGTNARIAILDPLGTTVEKGPAAYELTLRNLGNNINACLSGA